VTRIEEPALPPPRYDYGGDQFVFVELDEAMSFKANFRAMAVVNKLRERDLPGIIDVCPANASYMVRLDPDQVRPDEVVDELKAIDAALGDLEHYHFSTRIFEIPVLYQDPWTHEALMRFRDRHQNPGGTDLDYAARINGFESVADFITAHHSSPYIISMIGFVPGVPWGFQLVPRADQIQVPKYVRPRTDTPERALGHGGAFAAIYSVRGAGGYQLFGIVATPMLETAQTLHDFQESMVLLRPGNLVKFRPIEREEYDAIRRDVEAGTFRYRVREVDFEPPAFYEDPSKYNERLMEALYG
jgi:urea carboxylase